MTFFIALDSRFHLSQGILFSLFLFAVGAVEANWPWRLSLKGSLRGMAENGVHGQLCLDVQQWSMRTNKKAEKRFSKQERAREEEEVRVGVFGGRHGGKGKEKTTTATATEDSVKESARTHSNAIETRAERRRNVHAASLIPLHFSVLRIIRVCTPSSSNPSSGCRVRGQECLLRAFNLLSRSLWLLRSSHTAFLFRLSAAVSISCVTALSFCSFCRISRSIVCSA